MIGRALRSFWEWIVAIFGSRAAIAVFTLLFVAFAAHAVSAPNRLPAIPLDTFALGLVGAPFAVTSDAPSDPCGSLEPKYLAACRDALAKAGAAAAPEVRNRLELASQVLSENVAKDPSFGRALNGGLAALSFVLMFASMLVYARGKRSGRISGGETLSQRA